jgi:hypothetical protein
MNIISTIINIPGFSVYFTDDQRFVSPLAINILVFKKLRHIYIISYATILFLLSQIIRSFTLSGERGTGFSFMQTYRE